MTEEFAKHQEALWRKIGTHGVMVLSTCADNRVTCRTMSVVFHDEKFYCQTDENYLKYRQIMKNPKVALCYKNYSIEGVCQCVGKPLDENNDFFASLFKKHFYGSYKAYSSVPTERLLEITPLLVYTWKYELTKPYMEYWDFRSGEYSKEYK